MKVGYLCSDVDIPLYGHEGCSIHVREFVNGLADLGHEVFMLCASLGDPAGHTVRGRVHAVRPAGLDARAWDALAKEPIVTDHHLERDLQSVFCNHWLQQEGAALIARERPDFLYERYALFGWGGLTVSRRHGLPLILEVNAPLCDEQHGYEKFTLTQLARAMEKEILRGADAIVAVSNGIREWVVAQGVDPARVHVIPNAVAERLFRGPSPGLDIRARLGLRDALVVGFLGSFQPWQDTEGLLRVFQKLHRADARLRLLLIGDGPERARMETLARRLDIANVTRFQGSVPHEMVPAYLGAMDVAVVPYRDLPQQNYFSPMKLFEYMAAGRPVVAAALGQVTETVEHGKTGWLYPAGDESLLAEGISALLADRERADAMGAAARQHILEKHTWRTVAQQVTELARGLRAPDVGKGSP